MHCNLIKFEPTKLDRKIIEKDGRRIYNKNEFMRTLTNVMENPEFIKIFDEYFNNWDNIELFVLFSKVYHSITKQFPKLNGYEKISIVKKLIDDSNTRRLVCQQIKSSKKNNLLVTN